MAQLDRTTHRNGIAMHDSASLYGTADGGVLGNETPLSIAIRRWLANHPEAARSLSANPAADTGAIRSCQPLL